jgi:uncharacterized protein YdhG (YjbR/CyaY superfamily)
MDAAASVDEYLAAMPGATRAKLEAIRRTIREAAPEATEKIGYGIPTFVFHGNLVHFAGYEGHIGFYPGASGVRQFADELAGHETSKGTIRFPLDEPPPLDLVRRIVEFRVRENLGLGVDDDLGHSG